MIKTSEMVSLGHPDKIADYIADSILDAVISQDKNSKVACEVMVSTNLVIILGEVKTKAVIDYKKIALKAVKEIGYSSKTEGFDPDKLDFLIKIKQQSEDIAIGVEKKKQGAGDQGIMFGYATNETSYFLPKALVYCKQILNKLLEVRESKEIDYILPDAKCQVTLDDKTNKITDVVLSVNHLSCVKIDDLRKVLKEQVILKALDKNLLTAKTKYFINYTGRFVVGGPKSDCGLTGRKIIVDTYGGEAKHGGGAFSGKDPSKVDRSAAYMARYIAKNIVASKFADKCEVSLAYAIGYEKPVSFSINTFNTFKKYTDEQLEKLVLDKLSLCPKDIEQYLDLRKPIYKDTVSAGHFFGNFPWEKINLFN